MGRHASSYSHPDMNVTDKCEILAAIRTVGEQQWDLARGQAEIHQELGETKAELKSDIAEIHQELGETQTSMAREIGQLNGKVSTYGSIQLFFIAVSVMATLGAWLFPRTPQIVGTSAQANQVTTK